MAGTDSQRGQGDPKPTFDPSEGPEHGFEPRVKWNNRSILGPLDWICMGIFWVCILAQLISGFIILSSKNYVMPYSDPAQQCPDNYFFAMTQCTGSSAPVVDTSSLFGCVKEDLCSDLKSCFDDKAQAQGMFAVSSMMSQGVSEGANVPPTLWAAFELYWYIPCTIFPCMVVIGILWLYVLQSCVKPIVWGTLFLNVVLLVAFWAYWYFEYDTNNWMLLVAAGIILLLSALFFKSINRAADVIAVAARGLKANPSIFAVSLIVKAIFVAYVVLWTVFMIGSTQAKEVDYSKCTLQDYSWIYVSRYIFGLLFFVFTYVFLNMKTVICAAGIGAWYFPDPEAPAVPALKGLEWAFTTSSGAIMFAATVVGFVRFVINRITDACNCLPWCCAPIACCWACLAGCCLGVLEAFSKFMLIGQVFSGNAFCGSARRSFSLIKDRLGDAFLTDAIGHNVVMMGTYLFSLAMGIAAWLWLDAAQDYQTFTEMGWWLAIPVLLLYAAMISCPVVTIVLITWLADTFHLWACGEGACETESDQKAQRIINSVTGALFIGSVCYCFFHFVSDIVLCCVDTVFFCFAIEADNDVYQERFEDTVYVILKNDCRDQQVTMYNGTSKPLVVVATTTTATTTTTAPARPAATSPGYDAGAPHPSDQAMIGHQPAQGGNSVTYV